MMIKTQQSIYEQKAVQLFNQSKLQQWHISWEIHLPRN